MKKSTIAFSAFLFFIVFISSISGVFATWLFAEDPAETVVSSQNITLSEFYWKPEEILPSVTPGQNYLDLHASILDNDKAGLNSSKGTLENAVVKDSDGLLHCDQNIQGGNLKHLFTTQESKELDFLIKYVSGNEFLVYMYKNYDVYNAAIGVTRIQVYVTTYIKSNNTWAGKETHVGTALVQYLPNSNVVAIDVDTWSH